MKDKIELGISSCLLGDRVRYDGGHKHSRYIVKELGQYFSYKKYCPEMAAGLGLPRPAIRLIATDGVSICAAKETPDQDLRPSLEAAANEYLSSLEGISGYILKKDSPSCGMERVKVYRAGHSVRDGVGIFAERLQKLMPLLPIEEEGRLNDLPLRENFIRRVFVYNQWQKLTESGLSWSKLIAFHSKIKYVLFSYGQQQARAIGRTLSNKPDDLASFSETYIADVMALIKRPARRSNHVNVLQHIQGYLKRSIDSLDRQQMSQSIHDYRQGIVPLIVPVQKLRDLFQRHPNNYIDQGWYLYPHPQSLKLLNQL